MKRFKYAYNGMVQMFRKDTHFLIHILISLIVIISGFIFQLSAVEWLFILSAVFLVLTVEALNTSIEYAVDLVTEDFHELALYAKDISAFAVVLVSIYAVCTGLIIFLPKLLNLI